MQDVIVYNGDCLEVLRGLPDCSIDAVVCDPPYGLSFMGKKWDYDVPSTEVWAECLRVLKPGGHLLAFAGTRTQHRMAVRIEDAGFEIRDMIAWVYGSGFPKSLDVSKAIDGKITTGRSDSTALREVNETRPGEATIRPQSQNGHAGFVGSGDVGPSVKRNTPATDAARQWQGWGTALKPAMEPITVARKPLVGTVAENVLKYGTGAINVGGCRIETTENLNGGAYAKNATARDQMWGDEAGNSYVRGGAGEFVQPTGRWPANLIHDGSDEVLAGFPNSNGSGAARTLKRGQRQDGEGWGMADQPGELRDAGSGSAARFFYCAKASKSDRGEGNTHPTVKPTDLMRYLCRLVTPPGGVVLDPFMGSGSTGKAATLEGFRFIGIERDAGYFEIAKSRIGAKLEVV